ncbi:hypothetical protein [Flavobacterium sp. ov086]|uniref:hypothetical protein n=1 Tax=Flavobacterium sp. ov086 TaxID=1761785 RepID=UPI000B70C054|nr:hypothetical protein [Flavobacterium sp. ov086]SNR92297.1 hypothetical protein SAMN04487979_13110 [Flavobacterium sp. ov086]
MKYLIIIFFSFITFGYSIGPNQSGLKIYGVKGSFESSFQNCTKCFDVNLVELSKKPILEESDFESFNWDNQQITLNDSGKQKIKKTTIQLSGLPVVMVLNNKRIYGFWFWNMFSSIGCDQIYTYPKIDFKIKFGLPTNYAIGEDLRFNRLLEQYVKTRYKQD